MQGVAEPLPVGTVLHDRYEVVVLLGGGKYGQVYKVHDHNLDVYVALKLLVPQPGQDRGWAEAQLLQNLRSEFILPVLNAAVIPGLDLRYITMPLAEEGDLGRRSEPRGAALHEALRWSQQVATGMARMHDAGLLHRDVKPENVFLSHGDALLGDLGLAAIMDGEGTADPDGTQYTAAPELFLGGRCSVRSDVYSLAASAFIALTGRWPRGDGLKAEDVARASMAGDGPRLRDLAPHVPQAVDRVISRAMALNPADRYPSAAAFGAALGQASRAAGRAWQRTDEHPGHDLCLKSGPAKGKVAVNVCIVPVGAMREVRIVTIGAGTRLRAKEPGAVKPPRALATLRRVVASLN